MPRDESTRGTSNTRKAASVDLAHRLPDAPLVIYPDAGHGGVFQHHEKFVPRVLSFLA